MIFLPEYIAKDPLGFCAIPANVPGCMAGEHSTDFCTMLVSHSVGGSTHLSQTGHKRSRETIRCGKSIVHKFIILQVIPIASSAQLRSLPDTTFDTPFAALPRLRYTFLPCRLSTRSN